MLGRFIRRLQHVLVLLVATMAVGVLGFQLLTGCNSLTSFYYTISILTTLGLPDVPAQPATQIFVILLAMSGIGLFLYAITVGAQFMMEGEFERGVRRRKVRRQMKKMDRHYIICGYGRMGQKVAQQMREMGLPFAVIESGDAAYADAEAEGLAVIRGDATQEGVLSAAGVERARALLAVTSTDAENVLVTMTARQLNPQLQIVVRCAGEGNSDRFRRAGASRVITPYSTGAYQLTLAATKPHVIDWFSLATGRGEHGFEIEEVLVPERSDGVGRTLRDLSLSSRFGVMVIAIKPCQDSAMQFNPSAETRLAAGDLLICVGKGAKLEELERSLGAAG